MALTRRNFMKASGLASAGVTLGFGVAAPAARATESPTDAPAVLPAGEIPRFAMPLLVPPAMPRRRKLRVRGGKNIDYYEIAVRQLRQQVLPASMALPLTTVWGYGAVQDPSTFSWPSFTIEAKYRAPVRVKWVNELVDQFGAPLPHLFAVDQTLHWANPPGPQPDSESHNPDAYTGPVPVVTHLHGGRTYDDSDGYTEAWYLPAAAHADPDYVSQGSWYERFAATAAARQGSRWDEGSATFDYPNDQRAATLWYHDHALGFTRLNVYAGPAGFYLIRGGPTDAVYDRNGRRASLPGPAPALGDAAGTAYHEIPLVIQDRTFDVDGQLFYPSSREFFDGFSGPYVPDSDISPIWNPEFFGNAMTVNGRPWPVLEVTARRYRFRLLNGCNSRFLLLRFDDDRPFWQIGNDGGFLPDRAVRRDQLLLAPAERADVIVDFTGLRPGSEVVLTNIGPDEPFGGGEPGNDFDVADPATTGTVMQFRVAASGGSDASTHPADLRLPPVAALGPETRSRQLSLNEVDSDVLADVGPRAALLGAVVDGAGVPLRWGETLTENPGLGDTETWEFHNFTEDAHPMHVHQVQFEVVGRGPTGSTPPEPGEAGFKDTVIAYPDEVTKVKARFEIPGRFVWHCHIVEHEDNEMMRPFHVGPD